MSSKLQNGDLRNWCRSQTSTCHVHRQLAKVAGVERAFTNPDAGKAGVPGLKYICKADKESFAALLKFLSDLYGAPRTAATAPGRRLCAGARDVVRDGELVVTTIEPRFHHAYVEPFLVEETFASAISVMRQLAAAGFHPRWVELAYRPPPHAAAYAAFFHGQVRFGCAQHRMAIERRWFETRLPNYDALNSRPLRAQLDRLLFRPPSRADVIESVGRRLRASLEERVLVEQVARDFSMSERTLRRRLAELGVSFRVLLDEARPSWPRS